MPASSTLGRAILPAVIGALIGGGGVAYLHRNDATSAAGSRATAVVSGAGARDDLDALRADIARLKTNAPSQSHTMSDVGYHWTNLWFAAEKKNWPLAMFYFQEARSHILWTIQLRPVRKGPDGNDVNLVPIFESIDTSAFASVANAIQTQNAAAFAAAYRETLQACYGCHKTKSIINFDGYATWPQ
ncbi:MAG: hypothetical protein DMF88_21925 [Acidobacteria bacterium]|nr:MAG: hypothetical protein DMF88_21925 [Acidobacteriota bacterium]